MNLRSYQFLLTGICLVGVFTATATSSVFAEEVNKDINVYFNDDFDTREAGELPEELAVGAGGIWKRMGAPIVSDGKICTTAEKTVNAESKHSLRFFRPQSGSKLQALSATLRMPHRREAFASMDIYFDKEFAGKTNSLTLSLAQPDAARVARLIMVQESGSDVVTLSVEEGANAETVKQVGTFSAGGWHRITWGVDAGDNTVTVIVDGKAVADRIQVVPQEAAAKHPFPKGSLARLIFYPNEAGSIYIDNLTVSGISPLAPEAKPKVADYTTEKKQAIMCVDFFDLAYIDALINGRIYSKEQIRELLVDCKKAGVETVLWRVTACGTVLYKSDVQNWKAFQKDKRPPAHAAVDTMEMYDALWEACKVGHEIGMKVFAWVDLYDDGMTGSPHYSRILTEHPEYHWTDRNGKYCMGVPSYAFAGVRKFRVDLIKEVVKYPVDGLFLCFRTHATANPENKEISECGFEAPVVEEYKKRYGVDILTSDFDQAKWHEIKGEFFTQFLRELRESIHKEMPVWINLVSNQRDGPTTKTQHALDFDTWSTEGLVQGIVVCGPKIQEGKAAEESKDLIPIKDDIIAKYGPLREKGLELYYFAAVDQRDKCQWDYIPKILDNFKGTPFMGITIMEAYRFQLGDHRWAKETE